MRESFHEARSRDRKSQTILIAVFLKLELSVSYFIHQTNYEIADMALSLPSLRDFNSKFLRTAKEHRAPVAATATILLALPTFRFVYLDYHNWLALGPSGAGSSFLGWVQQTIMRMVLPRDTKSTACYNKATGLDGQSFLEDSTTFPQRFGSRPQIARYVIPHRQLNMKGAEELKEVRPKPMYRHLWPRRPAHAQWHCSEAQRQASKSCLWQ